MTIFVLGSLPLVRNRYLSTWPLTRHIGMPRVVPHVFVAWEGLHTWFYFIYFIFLKKIIMMSFFSEEENNASPLLDDIDGFSLLDSTEEIIIDQKVIVITWIGVNSTTLTALLDTSHHHGHQQYSKSINLVYLKWMFNSNEHSLNCNKHWKNWVNNLSMGIKFRNY